MTETRQKFVDDMREVLARLKEMRTEISQTNDAEILAVIDSVIIKTSVELANLLQNARFKSF